MGYVAVALIALTGAINTLLLVGSLDAMFDTSYGRSYGRLLAFKILLFLAMVVVALINRFRLAPRIFGDRAALRALGRTVALEQSLGLAVLAIVSVLGTCRRPSTAAEADPVEPICRNDRGPNLPSTACRSACRSSAARVAIRRSSQSRPPSRPRDQKVLT